MLSARHPGRRCRRNQRAAGCREAPLSRTRASRSPDRARTTNCSRPIGASSTRASITRAAACASASRRRSDCTALAADADCLVIDPDSRLTQLGLLPVCPEERYHFFESRAYGADTGQIAARTRRAMGARDIRRCAAPSPTSRWPSQSRDSRALPSAWAWARTRPSAFADPFEERLIALLAQRGLPICIDKGAGGAEAERVERAVARVGRHR